MPDGPTCADALRVEPGTARRPRDGRPGRDLRLDKATRTRPPARQLDRLTSSRTGSGPRARQPVLVVLQGIDAAGKDGTIQHVMSAFNPQGCPVTSFKVPSAEELAHDYLWRVHRAYPGKGEIAHLQPLALRGRARRPRPRARPEGGLVAALRPDQRVRAAARRRGHDDRQVLPVHRPRRAARAVPGAARRPDEALEVPPRRPRGAQALGRLHGGLRGRRCRALLDRRARRGTSSRRTASGSATSRSPSILADTLDDLNPRYPEPDGGPHRGRRRVAVVRPHGRARRSGPSDGRCGADVRARASGPASCDRLDRRRPIPVRERP